jgi:hypothetical protein
MMCFMCGCEPCTNPTFCRLSRKLEGVARKSQLRPDPRLDEVRLWDSAASLDSLWAQLNTVRGRAAATTVEALAHQLRGGLSALRNPTAQRRLSQLDETQLREICARLEKTRWSLDGKKRVPPWPTADIQRVMTMWSEIHDDR